MSIDASLEDRSRSQERFNLTGLDPLFREALERNEKTLAFEVSNGRGRFLFLMFFDDDDVDTQDQLFVYLRNIRFMMEIKLYGNHQRGQFFVYINSLLEEKIKQELGITSVCTQNPFDLYRFLQDLNAAFPITLPLITKIETLRANWSEIKQQQGLTKRIIDEENKTVLIGEKRVSRGKPQEKTLRKLYLYTEGNPNDIANLIRCLKRVNMTVAWTTPDSNISPVDIRELINRIEQN
jgi:hypothetical protein